jgi:CHAD domain-containing protein
VPGPATDADDTVAHLLGHRIASLARDVVQDQSAAHADQPDGVHDMRVSTRRLRSALATGRPFLDRTVTDPVRDELGWLADVLGAARDAEVRSARISALLDDLVAERADLDWEADLVRPALLAPLTARHEVALGGLREALGGRRYADLVGRLAGVAADPPWTDPASEPIRSAYDRRLQHELRRVRTRMQAATSSGLDPVARAAALHDARKAAKRARYAVEPLRPVYGKQAKKLDKRLKKLASRLGQLQDTVITREYLHDLAHATDPGVTRSVALVAGALIEREAAHAEAYDEAAMRAWKRVRKTAPPG